MEALRSQNSPITKVLKVEFPDEVGVPVKAYKKKQLTAMYGFSKNMLSTILERFKTEFSAIGYDKKRHLLSVHEVNLLFTLYGKPSIALNRPKSPKRENKI